MDQEKQFHPIANIFPLMEGEEYENFKADIKESGLREFIWLHPDESIIDGRNRYRACKELGINPEYRIWNGQGSLVSFVVSLNLHRRHLTSSQRAALAVEIEPLLAEEAKERQGQRTDLLNDPVNIREIIPEGDKGKAVDQAAELFRTNGRYVQDAKKLKTESPELFEQVKSGNLTIPKAKQLNQPMQVLLSHKSVEYYTPPVYIEAARLVMGEIDLDPASCDEAQETVRAQKFYTEADDGLAHEWHGRVWLNPPYSKTGGRSNQELWAQYLISQYDQSNVAEGLLLVKSALGYKWFEELWDLLPACFIRERLSFIKSNGSDDGESKHGTAIFYLGRNLDRFIEIFSAFGRITMPDGRYINNGRYQ